MANTLWSHNHTRAKNSHRKISALVRWAPRVSRPGLPLRPNQRRCHSLHPPLPHREQCLHLPASSTHHTKNSVVENCCHLHGRLRLHQRECGGSDQAVLKYIAKGWGVEVGVRSVIIWRLPQNTYASPFTLDEPEPSSRHGGGALRKSMQVVSNRKANPE